MRPTLNKPYLFPGDMVLVPAIAWPTTVWPLIQLGLKPCFVDISAETLGIDLLKAQVAINKYKGAIKAIFPIHPLGGGISTIELENFCDKNNLLLLNDVCESLGSWSDGEHVGTGGLAGSFSFYFSHHITTMEGGGIATNNDNLANDFRSIRSHGWSRDRLDAELWQENLSNNDSRFLFVSTGYNIRPMEIQAAIGIRQLADIDLFIEKRHSNALKVSNIFKGSALKLIGDWAFADNFDNKRHSWMMLPIYVSSTSRKTKTQIVNYLNESGIETRPILTGNFLNQPALKRIMNNDLSEGNFDVADDLTNNGFMIGNHHDFTDSQVDHVSSTLQSIL
jgi:CDP-6-deoxy-D-xylo-4-hexulose-3-dehydrase